ncbi:cell wall-binding repeat-containing protein [Planococcus sp. CP5-4]|uniref:cell wall-binding repeat-containing protein n=1 Tax=unclassified Planococcus (in: firmicutes) TaxID=2662419 RepID=UPI001C2407AE|nr:MULTISPECIES: cell wall-binding repeat-containing protein [unclassified Planococcus (in: firmicutes)]MBU9673423.1 cell wall-binding repeat-containing protein [Planococcus sp. CP5-4_YE]MBV0908196.1 cell wall-binding repeat-containing protein [Planococcus sp. CP5-4_UN]MBW6062257.1 cell wall-binding repeat-containing protein [Planococcus sp. CP5-4]
MPKKIFTSVMATTLALTIVGIYDSQKAEAAEGDFELTIMHTNDTHGNLDNAPKRATLIKKLRAENANNLLLDAGDVFSGTLYFNTFQGLADLELMNYMEYDAMVFGNHEFDLGASAEGHAALAEFVGGADFPLVGANVDFSKDANMSPLVAGEAFTKTAANGQIYSGVVQEVNGEEVGIFGLTTAETADISSPKDIAFTDYIDAANEAVEWFEGQDVNKIVALTHIGYDDNAAIDNDRTLASEVDGIDVIVGGHTHTKILPPVQVEDTVIVQANEYNKFLGQLDVTFDEAGNVTNFVGELHDVAAAEVDEEAAAILKPYADEIDELKKKEIGVEANVFLNGTRGEFGIRLSETNLGNFITDGMLAKAKTINPDTTIALQNGGGIRASIDQGPITYGEILTVLPFGNALAIMEVTGQEIKEALEHSVREYPKENGGFLHVSGMFFNYDGKAPAGDRVLSAFVDTGDNNFEELNLEETYTVATNTFTAKGGDGFASFGKAYEEGRVTEPGFTDWEMFEEHAQSFADEGVEPYEERRINQVRLSGADRYETAIAVSKQGWESADTVFIANGNTYADALTAAPLADQYESPILLTRSNQLAAGVTEEIARLGATKAVVLGGKGAVSDDIMMALDEMDLEVTRIGGKDRYETAVAIASELDTDATDAVVVSGLNFPDALSAGAYAALNDKPILLTRPDRIPASIEEELEFYNSSTIIGGTGAVSEAVAEQLPNARRVSGADRYLTSAAVAELLFDGAVEGFAANGQNFPDALTGNVLAAAYEAPMLLVQKDEINPRIETRANYYGTVFTTGGTGAVSPKVIKELHQ